MWLFDNLFLDKNTPMKINIGEENSPAWSALSNPEIQQTPPQEEIYISDSSSVSDIKNTDTSTSTHHIDTISSNTISDTSHISENKNLSTDSVSPSIDIGGDMNFDIGGDISSNEIHREDSFIQEETLTHPVSFSESSEKMDWVFSSENPVIIESSDIFENWKEEGIVSSQKDEYSPASFWLVDGALFSLLNNSKDDDVSWENTIARKNNVDIHEEKKNDISAPIMTTTDSLLWNMSPETSTKKIREILNQSINELQKIEVEDAFKKAKLMQQILEYDTHIMQIQEETEAKISELKLDRETLVGEMKKIWHEARGIKNIVQSFQKELDAV